MVVDTIVSLLSKYLGYQPYGSVARGDGITIIKSGSESAIMNYAVVDQVLDVQTTQELLDSKFSVNGFVLSHPYCLDDMNNLSGVRYIGRILVAISNGFSGEKQGSVHVEPLSGDNIKDYIDFVYANRGVEPDITRAIVDSHKDDMYVYLAYNGPEVIGAGSAIKDGGSVFIFDTIVREDQRNSGVFSAIVTQSMMDVSKERQYNYYALVSSEHSLAGALKANFFKNMFLDLWIREAGK